MLRFLRRLWSSFLRLIGRSPRVEPSTAVPQHQVSDLDYEGCLFALIEQVEAGGSWASLQAILIRRRMRAEQLADWLATFSQRWLAQAEDYQELAGQLRQLGEVAAPPLGPVATKVSQQLQIERDEVAEAVELSPTQDSAFVEQIDAALEEKAFEKALVIAESYIEQFPEDATARYKHGNSLYHLGRYEAALESYDQAIALQPDLASAWVNRGISLANLGRYESALESYDQAIALQPDNASAWTGRGNSLGNLGRYESALESYDQAIALQPDDASAWGNRGISLANLGRYESALESYDQAIALQPDDASAWGNRGNSLGNLGRYESALESYDQAIALQPDNAIAWGNRGISLANLGRYESALESYDQAIALQPDNASAWTGRGNSLDNLGRYESALESYDQAIALQPDLASAWGNRGLSLYHLGRYESALESYDQAIALQPDLASAWGNRGLSLYHLGRYESALESYDQAIALQPDLAIAWGNRGISLANLGRYESALESYDQAIALQPDLASAWGNRGISLANLGRYESALESYDQAIALQPDNAIAWGNRGLSLANLGRYESALESYDQAIALQPDNASAWTGRGNSLDNLGRYESALESYDQAIALQPDNAIAWGNRGLSLANLGRYESALESYDQAIALQPDDASAWGNRGISLANLGRYESALESYDQAIALQPDLASAWGNRGIAAYHLQENIGQLSSQFVSNLHLSLSQSKQQLFQNWQPPDTDALTQTLEWFRATAAPRLKEQFPTIADTFSPSLSPALQQFLQQPYNIEPVHACLQQPIPEALIQWLAQSERNHPHHANPTLNQRGYHGELASYRAPLDKTIRKDTQPKDWAELHQAIGKAHLYESKLSPNPSSPWRYSPRMLWQQAKDSFNTALSAPGLSTQSPLFYLRLLEPLIDLCIRLDDLAMAEELQRQGHDLITKLLQGDKLSPGQKQSFASIASRFEQLSVDRLLQQNKLTEALATAETGKNLCLRWLLELDEVPPIDLSQLQLGPHQAILYWHLSHSRLATFCLLPGDTLPRLIPSASPTSNPTHNERPDWLQQQLAWEEWLQQWNRDYARYSCLNKDSDKAQHPWRQNLNDRLDQLSDLLNVDAIKTELNRAEPTQTEIRELLLVPHRDLHRLPLHGFFADYTCRYLPHLPLKSADAAEPLALAPLLIVENPKHEATSPSKGTKALAALPFAELEAEYLRQLIAPQPCYTLNGYSATKARLEASLANNYQTLHFSGHGAYNASVPAESCLFLSHADRFTLIDIVQQDLSHLNLVTLAACETAVTGNETITDEYIGLVSAFLSAGARYVLSTLWPVESMASMVLIVEFYRNLQDEMPPGQALRQAQSFLADANRQTLRDWFAHAQTLVSSSDELIAEQQAIFTESGPAKPFSHPYYWSPFTLTSL